MVSSDTKHRLGDLAARFALELRGDPDTMIEGVGTLRGATASRLSFLANRAYRKELAATREAGTWLRAQ